MSKTIAAAQPSQAQPSPAGPIAPVATKTNTLAIISLVSSVFGLSALVGVITGHIALSQIKRTGESGRGLALAGLIIGYVGIAFAILGVVAWLFFFLTFGGMHGFSYN